MYKYLKKFKFKEETCIFNTKEKDKDRQKRFNKQRKKYGFDERETWSLDFTSATWLYSHLKMYLKTSKIVDLEYYKYDIPVLVARTEEELEYEDGADYPKVYFKEVNKELSQKAAIKLCIMYLKEYLTACGNKGNNLSTIEEYLYLGVIDDIEDEIKSIEKLKQAFKIYSIIIPAMWW